MVNLNQMLGQRTSKVNGKGQIVVRKLLQLIYKSGIYSWEKNNQQKITVTLIILYVQATSPFIQENKGCILLRL